jgi:hypothetical protein
MHMFSYYWILLLQHNLYNVQFDIPWGLKQPERGVNHPLHLTQKLKKECSYTSIPLCAFIPDYSWTSTFKAYKIQEGH